MNHDMEELMRRAAIDYPLIEGEDRWDEIGQRLSQANDAVKTNSSHYQIAYTALLLFLFLHMFLILNRYVIRQHLITGIEKENNVVNHSKQSIEIRITLSKGEQRLHPVIMTGNSKASRTNKIYRDLVSTDSEPSDEHFVLPSKVSYIPILAGKNYLYFMNQRQNWLMQLQPSNSDLIFISATRKNTNKTFQSVGFYYGVSFATHLSAIKELKFERTGFDMSVHLGYRMSSFTSIESGLKFSRKYYWTPGKYFSMAEMQSSMPSGMEMKEVNGSSMIFEIPVHFRYSFLNKPKHSLYASTGFSSYFLTEEKNKYHTMMNGTESKMYGNYKQNRNYFAASFDFSLGMEKQIGKSSRLRLEPYIQLPTRAVGVGRLPVKSAGLRLGIFRYAN